MRSHLTIMKALSDQTRLRALLVLRHGELCLCQLVELLGLAPSTVSKHINVLHEARLVSRRKQGRWAFFKLAGLDAPPEVRQAIGWVTDGLVDAEEILADDKALQVILGRNLSELCECYA